MLAHDIYDGVKPEEIRHALVLGSMLVAARRRHAASFACVIRVVPKHVPSRDCAVKNLPVWLKMVSAEGIEPSTY
jgi:hypothetical protein